MNEAIQKAASAWLGLEEWPGAKHNPDVVAMFAKAGHAGVKDDETPWCAAFVGAVLAECGVMGTGALNARSYLNWGEPVELEAAKPGDVVIFSRGDPKGWQGHVAFYQSHDEARVAVLGGNQGNAVSVAQYSRARLLGVRRAKAARAKPTESKTILAAATGAASAVGTAGVGVGALDGDAQLAFIVGAFIILIAFAVIFRERLKAWAQGWR